MLVFRSKKIHPDWVATGNVGPPTFVICAAAVKGTIDEAGNGGIGGCTGTSGFSCSSNTTICSWFSGNGNGVVPHVNGICLNLVSRHTITDVPLGNTGCFG